MVVYHCVGCRARYAAQPRRCDRCHGKSFAAVDDAQRIDDVHASPPGMTDLDPELAAAFASSERHRLTSLGIAVPAPPVLEATADDDAPSTPRDMPEQD